MGFEVDGHGVGIEFYVEILFRRCKVGGEGGDIFRNSIRDVLVRYAFSTQR